MLFVLFRCAWTTPPTVAVGAGNCANSARRQVPSLPKGNANRGTISYNSGIGTVTSNNATPLSTYSFTNPTNTNFVPGQTYTVTANITATVGSSGFVYIQWYDAGSVGAGTVLGTTIPEGSTGISTGTGVAPPTAAYFRILVQMSNSVTGDSVSYNQVGFWEGSGGQWAPPGQPIYQ